MTGPTEFLTISSHNSIFFTKLFTEFLTISSHNSIFYWTGGQFCIDQDSLK